VYAYAYAYAYAWAVGRGPWAVGRGPWGGFVDRERDEAPTDEEVAAALAAVRMLLRRRVGRGGGATGSRWARAGRAEAVAVLSASLGWSTAERPR